MSTLTQFLGGGGGGIKSIQRGIVDSALLTTNEEGGFLGRFLDVTISGVDPERCVLLFKGGHAVNAIDSTFNSGSAAAKQVFARLTSSTNLRLFTDMTTNTRIRGQWQVVEYA